jgi:hypothetical protein
VSATVLELEASRPATLLAPDVKAPDRRAPIPGAPEAPAPAPGAWAREELERGIGYFGNRLLVDLAGPEVALHKVEVKLLAAPLEAILSAKVPGGLASLDERMALFMLLGVVGLVVAVRVPTVLRLRAQAAAGGSAAPKRAAPAAGDAAPSPAAAAPAPAPRPSPAPAAPAADPLLAPRKTGGRSWELGGWVGDGVTMTG